MKLKLLDRVWYHKGLKTIHVSSKKLVVYSS